MSFFKHLTKNTHLKTFKHVKITCIINKRYQRVNRFKNDQDKEDRELPL
jgi:hypothetical protein